MDIKKRKRGDVDEEGISERKKKVSGFAEEKQNINKPIELVRTVKSLLQKEQTRLAGLKKLLNALKESHNKESVESIVKEGGEFLEVFKILEGGRHNLSQLKIQTCLEILENILLFTAEENQLASRTGMSIVQRVLQRSHENSCIHV
ncbi:hypothetical protein OS493_028391 [Desmophyllum pertusum]|uniref:Uncharacterized protein n=1 Tax=Desmophyllum pertusum TaxID=174260 RepID=A0A9W9ZXY3_9CNID|nr:hypothetical protein OS493_028391 [Desmophyllum pertusum]